MDMLSPGVYPQEADFSAFVKAQSTSVFGMVGVFQKGPVNVATRVTSLEEATSLFGSYVDGHHGMFALDAFFKNGGSIAEVVRVTHFTAGASDAIAATVSLMDRAGTPIATLKVSASSRGTWGNDLNAEIAASAAYPSSGFNLIVKKDDGTVLETFKDLLIGTANQASPDYVEQRINGVSSYIVVSDLASVSAAANNRPAVGSFALATGVDGLTGLAATDFVTGLSSLDEVSVSIIAVPGETNSTVASALVAKAELLKDRIAIIEVEQGDSVADMVTFRDTLAVNSTYAAMYGPWFDAKHPVTGRAIKLAPAGVVAGIYARNDSEGAVWTAPAGLQRGTVRGVTKAELRISQALRGTLYEKGINAFVVEAGALIVGGQRTLALKASKLDRVNVRRLMAYLEKSIADAAQFVVFEQNDKTTWERFKRQVNPFLQRVKDGRGLLDFLVVCDNTTNTAQVVAANQMVAKVQVKPIGAVEFINVVFSIAPDGASFTEV